MAETMHPVWSSDAALDEAFAHWVPGRLDDVTDPSPEPVDEHPSQLDELLGQLATVGPDPEPAPLGLWSRADDDILPRRRRGLRRRG